MNQEYIIKDRLNDVIKSIADLVASDVLVGIPESAAHREDEADGISNAAIGYWMEKGVPSQNIPARPSLVPGVAGSKRDYSPHLGKAAGYALDGDKKRSMAELNAAGTVARDAVKMKINSGDFQPLSDATLRARARRGRKGAAAELKRRAEGQTPGTDLARPLIDTAQFRNSITYVIARKDNNGQP